MFAPPLDSWRPLLGEILDPPLLMSKVYNEMHDRIVYWTKAALTPYFDTPPPKKIHRACWMGPGFPRGGADLRGGRQPIITPRKRSCG